jgi:hypothetical protein
MQSDRKSRRNRDVSVANSAKLIALWDGITRVGDHCWLTTLRACACAGDSAIRRWARRKVRSTTSWKYTTLVDCQLQRSCHIAGLLRGSSGTAYQFESLIILRTDLLNRVCYVDRTNISSFWLSKLGERISEVGGYLRPYHPRGIALCVVSSERTAN